MKRRHFLLGCACSLLAGCTSTPNNNSPKTICALRKRRWRNYNTSRWGKTDLTYHMLDRDTSDMSTKEWDTTWARSFKAWSDVSSFNFHPIAEWKLADIVIDVNKTAEGFGRKGNILAWAEMPATSEWDGQLWTQFDKAEDWVVEREDSNDTILQGVAVHEIGHLLGLGHSSYTSSIMYPYVTSDLILTPQEYDIRAIQTLYGE